MFTFRAMNVSNDAPMAAFSAIALYLIVRLIRRGFKWRTGICASLAIAGAFLSKPITIILPVPLMLTIISEKALWRTKLMRAGVLGAVMLAVVAPWLFRNKLLYGDLLVQRAMLTAVSGLIQRHSLASEYFRFYFPLHLITSFIGNFGWLTLPLPIWVYLVYTLALLIAFACWIDALQERRIDFRLSAIVFSVILLNLVVVVYLNFTLTQAQGRYLLPALPAMALLLGLGLGSLRSWSQWWTALTLVALLVSNLMMLMFLVIPAYWPPIIK
jgi:4-amino-4-deoxy-L-arabinose transferase-like glycosyltransferase